MEHLSYDLGNLKKGSTVVVTLQNQANVQLVTSSDYTNYKAGRRYHYHGGRVTRSPCRIAVPSNDHWVVAIDLGGYAGRISASVAVQSPPRGFLPPARSELAGTEAEPVLRDVRREGLTVAGSRSWLNRQLRHTKE